MRRIDDTPMDPDIAAQLDAIDATLAGDPVDPQYAELAELALLVTMDRPAVDPDFAASMDRRVAGRFEDATDSGAAVADSGRRRFTLPWREWMGPLAGLAAGCAAIAVVVIAIGSSGAGGSSATSSVAASALTTTSSASSSSASSSSGNAAGGSAESLAPAKRSSAASAVTPSATATSPTPTGAPVAAGSAASTASTGSVANPQPVPNGRKIVQSAQLALGTPVEHIDDVAQEVFAVAGREHAVVNNSNVTAGVGGSAQFQLSVPSSALATTMSELSQLHYANVISRTDATQDVNGQYLSDTRKLSDDRALRTSLLKQLANATTQEQIDSLNARIRDAEASIRSDEATLNTMNHKIDFSQVDVNINSGAVPVSSGHSSHSGSSFTLGNAAHDAGRVLTVVAGVILIALAVIAPLALLGLLAWWIWSRVRHRRREQALDLA